VIDGHCLFWQVVDDEDSIPALSATDAPARPGSAAFQMMSSIPVLRPYQADCVDRLRAGYAQGYRALLFQLATGAGKTIVFGEITRRAAEKGRPTLVVAHRRELIRQASAKLDWAGVPHGIIAAGLDRDAGAPTQVGSVQTIARRLDQMPPFDLIILDEAHHCRAATWHSVLAHQPHARLLGVTATPARLDGKGLGVAAGGCFDDLVCGPSTQTLIDGGFLSPVRCFVPERNIDLSGVRVRAGDYARDDLEGIVDRAVSSPAMPLCIIAAVPIIFRQSFLRAASLTPSMSLLRFEPPDTARGAFMAEPLPASAMR
jgi:superfamily II DNA or RNA helicase